MKLTPKATKIAGFLGGGIVLYFVFKMTGNSYGSTQATTVNEQSKLDYNLALADKSNSYGLAMASINVQNHQIDATQSIALSQIESQNLKNTYDYKLAEKQTDYSYLLANQQNDTQKLLGLTDLYYSHDIATHSLNNQLDIAKLANQENMYSLETSRIGNQLTYQLQNKSLDNTYNLGLQTLATQSEIAHSEMQNQQILANIGYQHDVAIAGYENAMFQGQLATTNYANLLNAGVANNQVSLGKKQALWGGISGTVNGIAKIIGNIYGGGIMGG